MGSYKFRGWDYEELAQCWGLELPEQDDLIDTCREDAICQHIWSKVDDETLDQQTKNDMVNFLFALKNDEHVGSYAVMWEALHELSDRNDLIFVQMFTALLPWMWT